MYVRRNRRKILKNAVSHAGGRDKWKANSAAKKCRAILASPNRSDGLERPARPDRHNSGGTRRKEKTRMPIERRLAGVTSARKVAESYYYHKEVLGMPPEELCKIFEFIMQDELEKIRQREQAKTKAAPVKAAN